MICLLFDICDLEFLITQRSIKIALTNRSPLGIVSANKQQHDSSRVNPALPEAVKVGFSFTIVICLAEKKIFLGYNFRASSQMAGSEIGEQRTRATDSNGSG